MVHSNSAGKNSSVTSAALLKSKSTMFPQNWSGVQPQGKTGIVTNFHPYLEPCKSNAETVPLSDLLSLALLEKQTNLGNLDKIENINLSGGFLNRDIKHKF